MKNLITVLPLATEKAYGLSKENIYVFRVPLNANKNEIVEAVEKQFEVKVSGVKTLVQEGKVIRAGRGRRRQPVTTSRKDTKKAYVKLAEGNSIKIFDEPEVEVAAKPEKKETK